MLYHKWSSSGPVDNAGTCDGTTVLPSMYSTIMAFLRHGSAPQNQMGKEKGEGTEVVWLVVIGASPVAMGP
jgi:hypothetical protein